MASAISEEQLVLLEQYIEAIIDEKIDSAFGRDALYTSLHRSKLRSDVLTVLVFDEPLED